MWTQFFQKMNNLIKRKINLEKNAQKKTKLGSFCMITELNFIWKLKIIQF